MYIRLLIILFLFFSSFKVWSSYYPITVNDSTNSYTNISKITLGNRMVLTSNSTGIVTINGLTSSASGIDSLSDGIANYTPDSVFMGNGAGLANSGTTYATGLGSNALKSNTSSGLYNTAVGYQALNGNTSGSYNTAIGNRALWLNSSGSKNTAIGSNGLSAANTGTDSVALGYRALYKITGNNHRNIGIGAQSLNGLTSGSDNIGIGFQTLYSVASASGSSNIVMGYQAFRLGFASVGNYNIIIGASSQNTANAPVPSLFNRNTILGYDIANPIWSSNLAIGALAMRGPHANTTFANGVYLGRSAQENHRGTRANDVAIGEKAGFGSGSSYTNGCVLLGWRAGSDITTGRASIGIGSQISIGSSQFKLNIGDTIYGDIGTSKLIGINTSSPVRNLDVTDTMRIEPMASPPSSPSTGDIYVDSSGSKALCVYLNSAWVVLAGAGSCS